MAGLARAPRGGGHAPRDGGDGPGGGGLGLVGEGAEEAEEEKARKEQEQKAAAAKKRAKVSVVRPPLFALVSCAPTGATPRSILRAALGQLRTDLDPPSCLRVGTPALQASEGAAPAKAPKHS